MSHEKQQGYLAAIAAYVWWGLFPIYFKWLEAVDALEILAHRVFWCIPTVLIMMTLLNRPVLVLTIWKNAKLRWYLLLCAGLISVNWFIFAWAVIHDQILATSLGYFINPIFSILLGVLFLHEKMNRLQWMAVLLALLGVLNQVWAVGEVPWMSLTLAITFGLYGFIRKQMDVGAMNGLLIETLFLLPLAVGYWIVLTVYSQMSFGQINRVTDGLLIMTGLATALPLILFAYGARRIPLYAIGFLQFIAPSMTFILAVFVYQEAFNLKQGITFGLIWLGMLLYLLNHLGINQKKISSDFKK